MIDRMSNGSRASNHRPVQLDDVSKAIIEQLQADGRRSYADIGKAVGLSEAAGRQRVQRLTEAGVMQIVAVTDPSMLGLGLQAMVGVQVQGDVRAAADAVAAVPQVEYVVITAGRYVVLVEVVAADPSALLDLVESIRSAPGVVSTEILTYLKLVKQTYAWGVY
jgi:Lrp/AsnC family transcriptional regulator for asnA, asnC and gidA